MEPTCGVVYFATGKQYVAEARKSAESVKKNTTLPVTLFTDAEISNSHFDEVRRISSSSRSVGDSIPDADSFPYERNLLLDTDTYVTGSLSGVFKVLDRFDLAVCHAPGRKDVPNVPDAITEYNTGVMAYRESEAARDFFTNWRERYRGQLCRSGHVTNQASFTETLYESDISFTVLPPEYNVRTGRGFLNGPAKIIHGRHPAGLKRLSKCLNATTDPRVFVVSDSLIGDPVKILSRDPILYRLQMVPFRYRNRVSRLRNKLVEGDVSTALSAIKRFVRRRFTDEPP